jgi:hypothetical protein
MIAFGLAEAIDPMLLSWITSLDQVPLVTP